MKTLKISEKTHRALCLIKNYHEYKTLDETIDMCIGEFIENEYLEDDKEQLKRMIYGK